MAISLGILTQHFQTNSNVDDKTHGVYVSHVHPMSQRGAFQAQDEIGLEEGDI